ncbi:MAG: hypothetical protein COU46_00915 [Candidatus Niyogibacteria bacterium CG10_big_fil_rev_8_21_14_0_10_42_19]|uniref:Uncharacterized protein n=1 Tax=Candidatus Niyogibacteria bacterium CG10_big_fil_rev_8_21_14_0_10_42_19 TaxID=1974725 RepID=A0A2H0TGA1_9BACT|nr:MAG: hypothetical protein COU46_00915 [Candidatus Niyogibacteria bacterium CG10_big_fil_rev_8_21_14_0_10_42_19]
MNTSSKLTNYYHAARIATVASIALPLFASAQDIESILDTIQNILIQIIPILMILATVIFLWGVITYITAGGDEEKIKSGRTYMLWGIIALFVMVVIWGLVLVLENTFGIEREGIPEGPLP